MSEGAREPKVVELEDIRTGETAWRFEGHEHGSTTSFFVTDHPPGRGPDLHRHPYDENFVVRSGRARFTVGEATIEAVPGQVVIVPPNTWHGFKAAGEENLKMVCIHPADGPGGVRGRVLGASAPAGAYRRAR